MTRDSLAAAAPLLDLALASRFTRTALDNVVREYPNKLDQVLTGPGDVRTPRDLHPAFYGSFDWHSCVHMHWSLARLRRTVPALPEAGEIEALLDRHLSPQAMTGELAYLARPGTETFERTYGWAWLLKLTEELARGEDDSSVRWQRAIAPLADAFVQRYLDWLPRARYPLRTGLHPNTAFGLALAIDYARQGGRSDLEHALQAKALAWYADDRGYPAEWEPSGSDFLSPALMEAELMRRVLPARDFAGWLEGFLPAMVAQQPRTLFTPAVPGDRTDGQMVHLDGLNLSRAWCWRGLANALASDDPRRSIALAAADTHLAAGIGALDNPHYMAGHWLVSFALLALEGSTDAA